MVHHKKQLPNVYCNVCCNVCCNVSCAAKPSSVITSLFSSVFTSAILTVAILTVAVLTVAILSSSHTTVLYAQAVKVETLDSKLTANERKIFNSVESNILSPFCPGRLLKDCPSSAARGLKSEIKKQVLSGRSPEEIIHVLTLQYGEDLRAAPSHSGFGLLAWYMPIAFLLIGGLILLRWIVSQKAVAALTDDNTNTN